LVVPFGVNPQGTGMSFVVTVAAAAATFGCALRSESSGHWCVLRRHGRRCGGDLRRDPRQSEQVASAQTWARNAV